MWVCVCNYNYFPQISSASCHHSSNCGPLTCGSGLRKLHKRGSLSQTLLASSYCGLPQTAATSMMTFKTPTRTHGHCTVATLAIRPRLPRFGLPFSGPRSFHTHPRSRMLGCKAQITIGPPQRNFASHSSALPLVHLSKREGNVGRMGGYFTKYMAEPERRMAH